MTGKTPRRAAVDALLKVHKDKAYSNMVLDTFIQENAFSPQDKALFSRLVYGCIEREMTVDYVMGKCSASSIARLHPTVREILRVGIYQLLYMDKIPPSAAVNEAVNCGINTDNAEGMVVSSVVIPNPRPEIFNSLM